MVNDFHHLTWPLWSTTPYDWQFPSRSALKHGGKVSQRHRFSCGKRIHLPYTWHSNIVIIQQFYEKEECLYHIISMDQFHLLFTRRHQ